MRRRVAAFDIGTNTATCAIASSADLSAPPVLEAHHEAITGLGRWRALDGTLDANACRRALDVIDELASDPPPGVERVAVATAALRETPNRDEVRAALTRVLGCEAVIIDGDQEAVLAFTGVTTFEPFEDECAVIDLGGASTEVAIGRRPTPRVVRSLRVGSVSVTDEFLHRNRARGVALATEAIDIALSALGDLHLRGRDVFLTGGGARALASIALPGHPASPILSAARISALTHAILETEPEGRERLGVEAARIHTIAGVALLVHGIIAALGVEKLQRSPYGVACGLAARTLATPSSDD